MRTAVAALIIVIAIQRYSVTTTHAPALECAVIITLQLPKMYSRVVSKAAHSKKMLSDNRELSYVVLCEIIPKTTRYAVLDCVKQDYLSFVLSNVTATRRTTIFQSSFRVTL